MKTTIGTLRQAIHKLSYLSPLMLVTCRCNVCKLQRLENELGIFPTISILKDKSKLRKLARCPIPSEIAPLSELEQRFINESQLTFDNHGGMKELKLLEERSRTEQCEVDRGNRVRKTNKSTTM